MTLTLGIDTGGTYTDAVILKGETEVVATAKSLTTKQDLALGIANAIKTVLRASGVAPCDISMASLSTTLATNALVEGQGDQVGLIYIGFRIGDVEKHGLLEALKGDPFIEVKGGHSHSGVQVKPLNIECLKAWIHEVKNVSAFAVASQFATRNPAHERQAADIVKEICGKPVSTSHQLSAKLNGPKRAVTALLNARLVGMIDRLICRTADQLISLGIRAPLMVVRGDGALISKEQAREKPIETILSGPAASIVGASWLTGASDAFVSDIGGTTTDVALLKGGRPTIDPMGAQVGPYRTMVEAVAMRTTGLGGDSEVHLNFDNLESAILLGPKRVLPVSMVAAENPEVVHTALDKQLKGNLQGNQDGRFVRRTIFQSQTDLPDREQQLLNKLGNSLQPLSDVITTRLEKQALVRLVMRGLVEISALTPTDASHILGFTDVWDKAAALKALTLFGRQRTRMGVEFCRDTTVLAQKIIDQLTNQTALALLETAFSEETFEFGHKPKALANHVLMQAGLSDHSGIVKISSGLNMPVIGIGASAPIYYPAVGDRLNCEMILPENTGVASAIGAVVGRVTMRASGTITSPVDGQYRVHLPEALLDFSDEVVAISTLEEHLRDKAEADAKAAGVDNVEVEITHKIQKANVEGKDIFVEAKVCVTGTGRPRITKN